MATLNFDATKIEPVTAYEPLPNGWYNVQIIESEIVPTKAGTGHILKLQQQVLDGEYKGHMIFANLNISNPNPKAQEIAEKALSAICHATGVIQCSDSNQLHGKPYQVKVKIRPPQNGYDASNECTSYKPVNGTQTASQPLTSQTNTANDLPDWAK